MLRLGTRTSDVHEDLKQIRVVVNQGLDVLVNHPVVGFVFENHLCPVEVAALEDSDNRRSVELVPSFVEHQVLPRIQPKLCLMTDYLVLATERGKLAAVKRIVGQTLDKGLLTIAPYGFLDFFPKFLRILVAFQNVVQQHRRQAVADNRWDENFEKHIVFSLSVFLLDSVEQVLHLQSRRRVVLKVGTSCLGKAVFKQKLELVILEPHTTFGDHRSVRVRTVFPRVPNTIIVHLFETFVGVSFASKILELDTTAPVSERRSLDEMLLGVPRKCIHHPAVEGDDDPVEDVKVVIVEDIRRKTRINESPEEEADGVEDDYEPEDDQDDHE